MPNIANIQLSQVSSRGSGRNNIDAMGPSQRIVVRLIVSKSMKLERRIRGPFELLISPVARFPVQQGEYRFQGERNCDDGYTDDVCKQEGEEVEGCVCRAFHFL